MLYIDLGTNTSLKDKQVLADKINQLLDKEKYQAQEIKHALFIKESSSFI